MATSGPGCTPLAQPVPLPEELREASGVAVSLQHPGVFWTHNDNGRWLWAVAADGERLARFRLDERLRDWEDIALGPCGDGTSCLFLADLGDNYEERPGGSIHRVAEPDPATPGALSADVFPVRLPDGPRDIEALLAFPSGGLMVVTKGRNHPVTVYRYPGPLRPDTVTLEEVQRLTDGPRIFPRMVTGGAVAPGGGIAALRTYESLQFYRVVADTLQPLEGGLVNLRTLREMQGEGVSLGVDGIVALTSEAGPAGGRGSLTLLRCRADLR